MEGSRTVRKVILEIDIGALTHLPLDSKKVTVHCVPVDIRHEMWISIGIFYDHPPDMDENHQQEKDSSRADTEPKEELVEEVFHGSFWSF